MGDNLVIAPTRKEGNETEENTIQDITADGTVITLSTPLQYTHHGITEHYDDNGHFVDIRYT